MKFIFSIFIIFFISFIRNHNFFHYTTQEIEDSLLWGSYKSNRLYSFSQKTINPLVFGLLYTNIYSEKIIKALQENLSNEKINIISSNELINNYENKPIFYKNESIIDYRMNDLMSIHNYKINDIDNKYFFNIKSIKQYEKIEDRIFYKWDTMINVTNNSTSNYKSLFLYFSEENEDYQTKYFILKREENKINIFVKNLIDNTTIGHFTILNFNNSVNFIQGININSKITYQISDILLNLLDNHEILIENDKENKKNNIFFLQFILASQSYEFQISYTEKENENPLNQSEFNEIYYKKSNKFADRFLKLFPQKGKGNYFLTFSIFNKFLSTFSYAYGTFRTNCIIENCLIKYPKKEILYFYENKEKSSVFNFGFSSLTICKWDIFLCKYYIKNWIDTISSFGHLTSKQIRGLELQSYYDYKIFFQDESEISIVNIELGFDVFLQSLLILLNDKNFSYNNLKSVKELYIFMKNDVYPKLQLHLKYILLTTDFEIPNQYYYYRYSRKKYPNIKWPNMKTIEESDLSINFNSGLEDYPRGYMINSEYKNLDLTVWISKFALFLGDLSYNLGYKQEKQEYNSLIKDYLLYDFESTFINEQNNYTIYEIQNTESWDNKFSEHIGYVNIFPLIFGLLEMKSNEFKSSINLINDTEHLFSEFGIRSLSKMDEAFNNCSDCKWRGDIWLSFNYLILKGLKNFKYTDDKEILLIYNKIRENLVNNVIKYWKVNGKIYERYDAITGEPKAGISWTESFLFNYILSEDY